MKRNFWTELSDPIRTDPHEGNHFIIRVIRGQVLWWRLYCSAFVFAFALLASAVSALADVRYVDVSSTNATTPYTNWATAAKNIQDAVDAAAAGDEVVVTNGNYANGGRNGSRVDVDKPLSLRSVNGAQFTTIRGDTGFQRFRCVHLAAGASLSGFTLDRGIVQSQGGSGGGAYGGTLYNCILTGNSALSSGGGAFLCTLNNCTLTGNSAADGGGAFECTLNNCTLTSNSAAGTGGPGSRGGAAYCIENNCILIGNTNPSGCEDCGSPGQLSGNNWYGNPLFVDHASGNLRLQSNSPCINAGYNYNVTSATDLDGNPRIAGGTVDIGAYEFQAPASMISHAWLQQFNLPINPATDTADPDGDGMDNYHEWLTGSDPTNRFSFAPLLTVIPDGANLILPWPTNAVGFTLQSTTNLSSPADWSTNSPAPVVLGGQNVVTNPISGPQRFYRLKQ